MNRLFSFSPLSPNLSVSYQKPSFDRTALGHGTAVEISRNNSTPKLFEHYSLRASRIHFGNNIVFADQAHAEYLVHHAAEIFARPYPDYLQDIQQQRVEFQHAARADASSKRQLDPIARNLLKNNIILLNGPVSPQMSAEVAQRAMLLVSAMNHLKERRPIRFIVNSPGGYITALNGILNTMTAIKNTKIQGKEDTEPKPIVLETYCNDYAASAASVIMAYGTHGHRTMGPFAEIMIHQPLGGSQGQASDMTRQTEHINKYKKQLTQLFSEITKLSFKELEKMQDRDTWMDAEICKKNGFVDEITHEFPTLTMADDDLKEFDPTEPSGFPGDDPEDHHARAAHPKTKRVKKATPKTKIGELLNKII